MIAGFTGMKIPAWFSDGYFLGIIHKIHKHIRSGGK